MLFVTPEESFVSMRRLQPLILLAAALAVGTWLGVKKDAGIRVVGPSMKIHFIDVGQGDSILIQSPDGKSMLIDAGEGESGDTVVSYLKDNGIKRLSMLAMTHPHSDHIGGITQVLDSFPVGRVLDSGYAHGSRLQEHTLEEIERKHIPYSVATAGQHYRLGARVDVEVLSPPATPFSGTDNDANNNSLVMRVTYGSVSALLTGDIESEAEGALLASRRNIESNILKVAHHGSADSTSVELLRQVRPAYVVISVGRRNEYGHPHKSTLRRLSPEKLGASVYRTDQDGTIVLTTDGNTVVPEVER
jgi:competence protein ComEC